MHRSAIIIFHKYLQLDTVANYGIESLITNGSIRRGVYTHDRGHIARTPRDCTWTLSMADRSASREPWMGQPSRFILPPPPHLIYSRASVSPSTHPPSNFDVDALPAYSVILSFVAWPRLDWAALALVGHAITPLEIALWSFQRWRDEGDDNRDESARDWVRRLVILS